jgi:hypothetical protein
MQSEAFQLARADIIELHEQVGIHHVPAVDLKFRVVDRALGDLDARGPRLEQGAVAPPIQLEPVLARARREIRQDDLEDVVTLDHIGIPFPDQAAQALERQPFAALRVAAVDQEQLFPAGLIAQRDGRQVVRVLCAIGLEADLPPAERGKIHPLEERPAGGGEVLLDRIGEREMGHFRIAKPGAQPAELGPIRTMDEVVVREPARERFADDAGLFSGEPKERGEGGLLDGRRGALFGSPVNLHVPVPEQFDCDDPACRVQSEQGVIFLELHGSGRVRLRGLTWRGTVGVSRPRGCGGRFCPCFRL